MPQVKAITLAPTVLDRNGISTTETLLATRLDYLINGALATGYDADGIVASAVPVTATAMTIKVHDYSARKGAYILIESGGGDETGGTFVIVGIDENGNGLTETITGPDTSLIVLGTERFSHVTSVTPAGTLSGSAVTVGVNGYVDLAAAGAAQHVAIYSAGDDSSATILVTGENRYGDTFTETITGANTGTSSSQSLNFGRVDRLTISTGSAGATEAGIDGLAESQWYVLNYRGIGFNVGLGVDVVSGTLTYAVQHTWTNVTAPSYTEGDETVFTHDTITGKSVDFDGNYTNPPVACRLAFTAFTTGSAILHIAQSGNGS